MKKILTLFLMTFLTIGCAGANNSTKSVTLDEAKQIALEKAKGEVVRTKENNDSTSDKYEVDVKVGDTLHTFDIASNGDITSHEQTVDKSTSNNSNASQSGSNNTDQNQNSSQKRITASQANAIALKRVGGGRVTHTDLDRDDSGYYYYEIEIVLKNREYELEVHAVSGKILKIDSEIID